MSTPTPPPPTQGPTTTTTTTQGTVVPVPQELEQTLSALSSHRSVLGYLLIARGGGGGGLHSASIIRHSGVVFEGEKGRKYAGVIARIVENVQAGLEEVNSSSSGGGGSGGGGIDESSEAVSYFLRGCVIERVDDIVDFLFCLCGSG